MPRPTSRSSGSGHLAGFTKNIYAKWRSTIPLPLARVNMTMLSTGADGNPQQNEMWTGNQLQWSLFDLIPPRRTLWTTIMMFTSYRGCWGRYTVMRRQRHVFARRSWTLLKNASGISGFPHCQGQNWDGAQLMSLGLTLKLNSMPGTVPLMIGSWTLSKTPAKKLWPWQEMPTNGNWWLQHFWRTKLRGWAALSAAVADALEVTDTQAATSAGDPRLWIIKPKSPRWHHAMGTLLKGEPSHPALPDSYGG